MSKMVYLASAIDFAGESGNQPVRALVRQTAASDGDIVYDPASAFVVGPKTSVTPQILDVNTEAVDRADGLYAILMGRSIGVPREIERARKRGIPVVVVTDQDTAARSWSLADVPQFLVNDWHTAWIHLKDMVVAAHDGVELGHAERPAMPFRSEGSRVQPPRRGHDGDAGLDLTVLDGGIVGPGKLRSFACGLSVAIPEGSYGLILGRSGLHEDLEIRPAVIDAGYRGALSVRVRNHSPVSSRVIPEGTRLAQMIVMPFNPVVPQKVQYLPPSTDDRDNNGFGSTGGSA